MINFKNDIKEQVNFALRELNSSIDMLYTANNLLSINRILEQMRLQISNLIYLNEVRDKYTIKKPSDTDAKIPETQPSESDTLKSDTLTSETLETEASKAEVPQTDVPKVEYDTSVSSFSPGKFNAIANFLEPYPEDAGKTDYISQTYQESVSKDKETLNKEPEKQASLEKSESVSSGAQTDKFVELKPIRKDRASKESKMSELDRLVARLIEDNLDKDKNKDDRK